MIDVPYGFLISSGYVGYLPDGSTMEFETEDAYKEYLRDHEEEKEDN